MTEILEYLSPSGVSPYQRWFGALDSRAAGRVTKALRKLENGNTGSVKPLDSGVMELKIHFGPGYRVYFGWDGPMLVLLLGGGSKQRQDHDIATARDRRRDYLIRKRGASCH